MLFKFFRPGPYTMLGRWCGPWYNPACNAMKKGELADIDNSVWYQKPRVSSKKTKVKRDPVSVFLTD